MKTLNFFLLALSVFLMKAHALDGLTTTIEPKPPYGPGQDMHIVISGPGVAKMEDRAYLQFRGEGNTYLDAGSGVNSSGNPPKFDFIIKAPVYSNTATPEMVLSFDYLNGVTEVMNSENTPAFKNITYTGLTIDTKKPKVSNVQFKENGNGKGILEWDVDEEVGLGIGTVSWFVNDAIDSSDSLYSCTGGPPKHHCTQDIDYASTAGGKIRFAFNVDDLAGNITKITNVFDLEESENTDKSKPTVDWPAQATVCRDRVASVYFKTKGGNGIHNSRLGIWSDNPTQGNSSWGLATRAELTCTDKGECGGNMSLPELVGPEQGSINANVDGDSSISTVGGVKAGNFINLSLQGENGLETEYKLGPRVLAELMKIPEGNECNVFSFTQSDIGAPIEGLKPTPGAQGTY